MKMHQLQHMHSWPKSARKHKTIFILSEIKTLMAKPLFKHPWSWLCLKVRSGNKMKIKRKISPFCKLCKQILSFKCCDAWNFIKNSVCANNHNCNEMSTNNQLTINLCTPRQMHQNEKNCFHLSNCFHGVAPIF